MIPLPASRTFSGTRRPSRVRARSVQIQCLEQRLLLSAEPFAHWKFDEQSGNLISDSSANGAHGVRFGAVPGIGVDGGALWFDGVDDRVEFGTQASLNGLTDFTVTAWVRTTSNAAGTIIQQRDVDQFNGQYRLQMESDGSIRFTIFGDLDNQFVFGTNDAINDGEWHHVAAGRQGRRGFIYVDGRLASETFGMPRNLNSSIKVAIGADVRDGLLYFQGLIDDVRIYDSALDSTDIGELAMIVTPNGTTENQYPEFRWPTVESAVSYHLWVEHVGAPTNPSLNLTVTDTTYVMMTPLGIGQYRAWVRANLPFGANSEWISGEFAINTRLTMQPVAPQQTTARPTIAWDAVPGATFYDLWLENRTSGQGQYVRDTQITSTAWTPDSNLPLGVYRVWVRGIDIAGYPGLWSQTVQFTVMPASIPLAPLNPGFNRRPTFEWTEVTGAVGYELLARNVRTGANTIHEQVVVGTTWTPATDLADDTYRWWVRPIGSQNVRGTWSVMTEINIGGRTTVLAPNGATELTLPTFYWRTVDGAVRYELWVDRIGVQAGYINLTSLTSTSYTPTTPLPLGNYRVWVRAVSATNEFSLWSAQVNFSVVAESESAPAALHASDGEDVLHDQLMKQIAHTGLTI